MYFSYRCSKCGKPVSKDTQFCPHCGARIIGTRVMKPAAQRQAIDRPSTTWLKIIGSVVIFLVSVTAAGLFMDSTKENAAQKAKLQSETAEAGTETVQRAGAARTEIVQRAAAAGTETVQRAAETAGLPIFQGDLYQRALAGEFHGKKVEMRVVGIEGSSTIIYPELMDDFTDRTGIRVNVESITANALNVSIAAGDPPDIAATSDLLFVAELARQGLLVDPGVLLGETVLRQRYDPRWLEMAAFPGPQGKFTAGIWHTYAPQSLVFYASDDFKARGYQPPETWDEMVKLSDQIVAGGDTPWCIGNNAGEGSGWMTGRWLEDILLRTQPESVYRSFSRGELAFDSPQVRQALDVLAKIWFSDGYVYGGPAAINEILVWDSPDPLFTEPPGCWLHLQGSYIAGSFPSKAAFGKNYDWFPLPAIEAAYGKPQVVGGMLVTLFARRPEVGAVADFLAHSESAKPWVSAGTYLSPHKDADLNWIQSDFMRSLAGGMSKVAGLYPSATYFLPQEAQINLQRDLSGFVEHELTAAGALSIRSGKIADLASSGSITVKPKGAGIDALNLDIENLLKELLDVEIPVGTYFVSGSAGVQNMVVRTPVEVRVKPGELLSLLVDVACANMERDVPTGEDKFTVKNQGSTDLARLMPALEAAKASYDVAQAAVWIVTDNADYDDLGTLVSGLGQARVIHQPEAAQAMRLVDEAGIDIAARRIWADREMIAYSAGAELEAWIKQRE